MKCRIIFRYDDLSHAIKPIDEIVASLFCDYHVKLSVGFIPFFSPLQQHVLPQLFLNQYIEPAIHGYAHVKYSVQRKYLFSEFVKRPYQEQCQLIKEAKNATEIAFNSKVYSFIPPWNSYDMNTLSALLHNGIKNVSARITHSNPSGNNIQLIPATCSIGDLFKIVEKGKLQLDASSESLLVVNFHSYELVESKETPTYKCQQINIEQLQTILKEVSANRNASISIEDAGNTGKFSADRYLKNLKNFYSVKSIINPNNKYIYL